LSNKLVYDINKTVLFLSKDNVNYLNHKEKTMAEPKNKNSFNWRDWHVRRYFGEATIDMIKVARQHKGSLDILVRFIEDIKKQRDA